MLGVYTESQTQTTHPILHPTGIGPSGVLDWAHSDFSLRI